MGPAGIPAILFSQNEGFGFQGYFSFPIPAVILVGFAFLGGRFFTANNFVTFYKKIPGWKGRIVRQPVFGEKLNIKKIAIFSCSGIVFLVLLIPAIIVLGVVDLRSKVIWRSPIKTWSCPSPSYPMEFSISEPWTTLIHPLFMPLIQPLESNCGQSHWTGL